MTPQERAAAIAAAIGTKTLSFSASGQYGSVNFSVANARLGTLNGCTVVRASVQAWTGTGGNKRYLQVDPDQVWVNPPLAVNVDANGNGIRDDIAAAKDMVYRDITVQAYRAGWRP